MTILMDEQKKLFTIHTQHSTYQMAVNDEGELLHLYYGKRIVSHSAKPKPIDMRYLLSYYDRGASEAAGTSDGRNSAMEALPREYPGSGDWQEAALRVGSEQGELPCELRYVRAKIRDGKYEMEGMPGICAPNGAQTLEILLRDSSLDIEVTLLYGVLEDSEVITRAAKIKNCGSHVLYLEKAASCCLGFLYGQFELVCSGSVPGGRHQTRRTPLTKGRRVIRSCRGGAGLSTDPLFILAGAHTEERFGICYGFQILYSGDVKGEASADTGNTRVMLGLSDEHAPLELLPQAAFDTPEAVVCYQSGGFDALEEEFSRLSLLHDSLGRWKTRRRPENGQGDAAWEAS